MKIKESCPEIMKEIFNFVIKNMKLKNFEELTKVFRDEKIVELNTHKNQNKVKTLNECNFYDLSQYDLMDLPNEKALNIIMLCSSVKGSILEWLENGGPKIIMVQLDSPPIEAYEYIPFNKMDITYSDESFGLTFE